MATVSDLTESLTRMHSTIITYMGLVRIKYVVGRAETARLKRSLHLCKA